MSRKLAFALCVTGSLFGKAYAVTQNFPFYVEMVTRNEQLIAGAAARVCPTGPEITNSRLIDYRVTASESRNDFIKGRKWKGWGEATCAFERVVTPNEGGPEELPDLNGDVGPWNQNPKINSSDDDGDQLGNP